MEGIVFFGMEGIRTLIFSHRCSRRIVQGVPPKLEEGLYRVSHHSWNKAGKRQGNRNMYGRRFFGGNFWISSHRCRRGIGNFYHLPDLDRWIHLMRRNLKRLRNQHCTTNHKWNTVGWKLFHWDIRMNRSCRLAGTCRKPEKRNNFLIWYFVSKIVLTYFWNSMLKAKGTCRIFEISKTIYKNSER